MFGLVVISHINGLSIYKTFFNFYRSLQRVYSRTIMYDIDSSQPSNVIVNTPAGLYGFYTLGVNAYIKQHYDITNYSYSGASAGAWNSVFLSFKGNDSDFLSDILTCAKLDPKLSILEIEKTLKQKVVKKYTMDDFRTNHIYIGVSVFRLPRLNLVIFNNFRDIEDLIDCCIASSHIPFITGGALHKYRNKFSFDGGYFKYPYINNTEPTIIITPSIWNSIYTKNTINGIKRNQPLTLQQLYQEGYDDSKKNKDVLDKVFGVIDRPPVPE